MSTTRPDVLEGAPLRYAPKNELGVVFFFYFHIWQSGGELELTG